MSISTLRLFWAFVLLFSLGVLVDGEARPKGDQGVKTTRQIEPRYPIWAYNHGIGRGYAKIAFYVDEHGETSEFFAIEYSHAAFAEELMAALLSWDFAPAHENGIPVKSVCHAYWEFLPDRAIETNALFDVSKRMDSSGSEPVRELKYREDAELDSRIGMLSFPGLGVARGSGLLVEGAEGVRARVSFFVDAEGRVILPHVVDSSAPEVNELLEAALKKAAFSLPVYKGKGAVALLERTYDFPVVWLEREPDVSL